MKMEIKLNLKKKKVSDVAIGDDVYCYNEFDDVFCVSKVSNLFTPTIKREYQEKILIGDEAVYTSSIHPFYDAKNKKWVESQEIDSIFGMDVNGGELPITNDQSYESDSDKTFYDFTVDGYHNYFVGKNGNFALTHNSATTFFPVWHKEIEDIIVLKNNKGTEDNRVRNLDYAIQFSKIFYERFIKNEEITLFSPHDVPGLYDKFGLDGFDELYVQYENDPNIPKKKVKAQELILDILKERAETGRIYIMNMDHVNSHGSFKDQVTMSNLCVAPETQVLTKHGYQTISELEGLSVDVWNGEEWSTVDVHRTSDNQELIEVHIGGEVIECTPYHRFFVVEGNNYSRDKKFLEKRACELKPGDRLVKFELPVIEGEKELEHAYALGFHSGDGSYSKGRPILDLYGDKQRVLEHLPYISYHKATDRTRTFLDIPPHTKFVVPDCEYTIESRLKWLAGLVDSDGHIARNQQNESIQIVSIHNGFLKSIRYMLHTLGVDCKIKKVMEEGMRPLPDGHGGMKDYLCKESWRLLISSNGLMRLLNLGFGDYIIRSTINGNVPNRNAQRFHAVDKIVYNGRHDATYCFTEEKRGMGMFNGFLLGNCMEITLRTKPINHIDDEFGKIALCILSCINVGIVKSDKELEDLCDIIVRFLDELIDHQEYPVKAAEITTRGSRSLGIGMIGLAHYLAKLGYKYDDPQAWEAVHGLSESIQYYLLKASNQLAKEKGPCDHFSTTKYHDGILPIDTYKKEVDEICSPELQHDWEQLRKDILEHGLRHTTLTAQPPTESSSVVCNSTNGIEPPRDFLSIKQSKKGTLKQIVPQYTRLKNNYTLLWDMPSNEGYINIVAVMQKFFDQAISANWSYNPENYPNKEVPISVIVKDFLSTYKVGHKTAYYHNTYDGKTDDVTSETNTELDNIVNELISSGEEECVACNV